MLVRVKGVKRVKAKGRIYFYHRATGERVKAEPDSAAFVEEVRRLDRKAAGRAVPQSGTLGHLFAAYRASPEFLALAPRTRSDYQKVLDWLQPIAGMAVDLVDTPFVMQLRDRAFTAHKRRFANYTVQVIGLVFKWGRPHGLTRMNPATDVPSIRRPRGMKRANRAWTDRERAVVLGASSGSLRAMILLGMFGGLREGDAARFGWASYNGRSIAWTQGKTGDAVDLLAHPKLRAGLDHYRRIAPPDAPAVALTAAGRPYTLDGFRTMFFRLIRRLEAAGKVAPGLTFHGLRHTLGKLLDEAGCSTEDIAAVLGHRTLAMAQHYKREGDRRRRGAAAINAIGGKKNKRGADMENRDGKPDPENAPSRS